MYSTPLNFLGPMLGKRLLVCGAGAEVVGFALAGADVYGFDVSSTQVEATKDLVRSMGLRDRAHLQATDTVHLAYPNGYFDLIFSKAESEDDGHRRRIQELARVLKRGGRAAFLVPAVQGLEEALRKTFGAAVRGQNWIGVEKTREDLKSHWSDLNRRPLDYESRALPLSYSGGTSDALARIRTATPFGTTPSR